MRRHRAYTQLYDDIRRFVARRAPPEAVDDLTQDIFLKMHHGAGELRDVDRLAAWAFRIARNTIVDHLRSRRTSHIPLDEVHEPVIEQQASNVNRELATWFRSFLASLPDEYATALELTEMDGLSQRELAARAGLSLSGAKSRVQRGRKLLEGVVRTRCDVSLDARGNVIACAPKPGAPCRAC